MSKFVLGKRSLQRLRGMHPDLVRVVKRAIQITDIDFSVLEGVRTRARQRQLFEAGATRTMNSRHLTGHAVDIAPYVGGRVRWDWPLYDKLALVFYAAARGEAARRKMDFKIIWGGEWKTFRDGPHWELPWSDYPLPKD